MTEQSTAATQPTDAAVDTATSATTAQPTDAAATTTDVTTQTPTTDTASTETGSTDAKTDDKPAGAPEKYEFTPPEGTQADPVYQEKFEGIARELNLTQDQANKLYALGGEMAQAQQKAFETALQAQSVQWEEATRNDKEIGGDKFDASVAAARKAMGVYATPEFRELCEATRIGNHPEFIRLMTRIGQTISDDMLVNAPSAGGSERRSAASVLFDHPTSQKR